jgi:hypothetical protein
MPSLVETLMQQLGGDTLRGMSQQLGTDESTTRNAVGAALPVLVGAIARNASSEGGATSLANALERHDGSILGNVSGSLGGLEGMGGGILKHVLGRSSSTVAAGVGQASGLNTSQAGSLMAMLAPLVMGALGRAQRSQGLDPGGLAAMLGQERAHIQQQSGGALGGLMGMLDADHDGSVVDDIGGMVGKMFNR